MYENYEVILFVVQFEKTLTLYSIVVTSLMTLFVLAGSIFYVSNHFLTSTEGKFPIRMLIAFLYLSHLGISFPEEPTKISTRIAFLSISFCGYFMFSLYETYIGAFLGTIHNILEWFGMSWNKSLLCHCLTFLALVFRTCILLFYYLYSLLFWTFFGKCI